MPSLYGFFMCSSVQSGSQRGVARSYCGERQVAAALEAQERYKISAPIPPPDKNSQLAGVHALYLVSN